jgi:hypothetical protein
MSEQDRLPAKTRQTCAVATPRRWTDRDDQHASEYLQEYMDVTWTGLNSFRLLNFDPA